MRARTVERLERADPLEKPPSIVGDRDARTNLAEFLRLFENGDAYTSAAERCDRECS
jgi:hypothetical protein